MVFRYSDRGVRTDPESFFSFGRFTLGFGPFIHSNNQINNIITSNSDAMMMIKMEELNVLLKRSVALARQCEPKLKARGRNILTRLEQIDVCTTNSRMILSF